MSGVVVFDGNIEASVVLIVSCDMILCVLTPHRRVFHTYIVLEKWRQLGGIFDSKVIDRGLRIWATHIDRR